MGYELLILVVKMWKKKGKEKRPYFVIGLGSVGAKIVNEIAKWLGDVEIVAILTNEADKIWITEKNVHILPIAEMGWGGLATEVPERDKKVATRKIKAHLRDMVQEKRLAFFVGSASGSTFTSLCPILCEELYDTWGIYGFPLCSMPLENAGYDEWRNVLYLIETIENNDGGTLSATLFDSKCVITKGGMNDRTTTAILARPILNIIRALKSATLEEKDIIERFGKKNKWASFFYREMEELKDPSISEVRYCELVAQEIQRDTMADVPTSSDFVPLLYVPDNWKGIPLMEDVTDTINDTHPTANIVKTKINYGAEFYRHLFWVSIDINEIKEKAKGKIGIEREGEKA